jgi:hypothetical protein
MSWVVERALSVSDVIFSGLWVLANPEPTE